MPQTELTPEQRAALEAAYTALTGAIAFLEEIQGQLQRDNRITGDNLGELARMSRHKLIAGFPELLEWQRGGE